MRRSGRAAGVRVLFGVLLATLAAPPPCSGQDIQILGTIRATVDGEPRTWHVVRGMSRDRPYASAMWWSDVAGETIANIGGFDTTDLPLDAFEYDPMIGPISFGDYVGAAMAIVGVLSEGSTSMSVELGADDGLNSLVYVPAVSPDFPAAHLSGSGSIAVTDWDRDGDVLSLNGVFSGTVALMDGSSSMEITGGTFEVTGVPSRDSLVAGGIR